MGRDITGLRVSSAKAKPNGVSCEMVQGIYPKTSTGIPEAKGTSLKEGMVEVVPDEKSNSKHDFLGVKSPNLEDAKNDAKLSKVEEAKSSSPDKSALDTTSVKNVQTKHIVQNSLDVKGDQNASASPNVNILPSPSSSKKSQSNSPFVSRKHLDDEDSWSMASSTAASVRTARSRTTVPVAPKFSVTERLEKRKEFYAKLDEKHKALEAEKREYDARNKEEEQATIKQLRKTMVYKANPVPSFYREGPPPKKELKKLPTTRPVSPKLGRRKSCGDAASLSEEKVACGRALRYSLGNDNHHHSRKQASVTPTIPRKKGVVREQSGSKGSLRKEQPKQFSKESSPAPPKEPRPKQLAKESPPAPSPSPAQAKEPESATAQLLVQGAAAPTPATATATATEPAKEQEPAMAQLIAQ